MFSFYFILYKKSNIIESYRVKKFSKLNVSVLLYSLFFCCCFPNTVHVIILWRSLSYSRFYVYVGIMYEKIKGEKFTLDLY